MKVASVSEAKNKPSALLALVRGGETVLIADRSTPVARLVALPGAGSEEAEARLARLERAGLVRRGSTDSLAVLAAAPPRPVADQGRAALDALLEERRTSR